MPKSRSSLRPPWLQALARSRRRARKRKTESGGVAIIGMSCRFPGARNVEAFWENLCGGVESISFYSPEELISAGNDASLVRAPQYVRAGSVLEDVDHFDAAFFGINPREAESMDPQQRLFLECAWHALEDAGYDPERYRGAIGVYGGCAMSSYFHQLQRNPEFMAVVGYLQALIGNDKDYLTTHVSYKLNLTGPSLSVQTTCSTSLVSVCLASQSLLDGHCDMALAGGVCVRVPQKVGYFHQPGGIFSPDGHCRVFDAKAQGVVFGNGVGLVVLKRLQDALTDGDCIHAVIKAAALNNDGSAKASYTAPGLDGQAEVIARAHAVAGIEPQTVTYVETHGTATTLGDPIEIAALTKAFRTKTRRRGFCAVGSVKTNFGHLDHAAGVAGLIKTVLALRHRLIPPSLHFETPNPHIDFSTSPFFVCSKLMAWKSGRHPRRAGVSAFGIGGTNAHVVLEEAPPATNSPPSRRAHLLLLSARSAPALEAATANLVRHLKAHPGSNMADVAHTTQVGRRAFNHRRMLLCRGVQDAVRALESADPTRVITARRGVRERKVVFMFSGQGSQYVRMGAGLYRSEPVFREQMDLGVEFLKARFGLDLAEILYPPAGSGRDSARQLTQTAITQPALFVIEYALAQMWIEWGVRPQAMMGHSIGEYVAACLSGVFSFEDALALVAERGRLMQPLPGGSMWAVPLSEEALRPHLSDKLDLAAVNEPALCVVSGPTDTVDPWAESMTSRGIPCRRVHTSHAFHSAMMEPILESFTQRLGGIRRGRPRIPFVSNVTGDWITDAQAASPRYWADHLRRTVRFSEGLQTLFKEPDCVLLEVGPGHTLATFARRHPQKPAEHVVLASMRHVRERLRDNDVLLNRLGRLWLRGVPINWSRFSAHEQRRRVPLPGYPFERQRYWVDAAESVVIRPKSLKKPDIADWFYVPSWKKEPSNGSFEKQAARWLIFEDDCGLADRMTARLQQEGEVVFRVRPGDRFSEKSNNAFEINPGKPEDFHALMKALCDAGTPPQKILYLWCLSADKEPVNAASLEHYTEIAFHGMLRFIQALLQQRCTDKLQIAAVTSDTLSVTGDESIQPAKSLLLGPCTTIPQEYPHIRPRLIDVVTPKGGAPWDDRLIGNLLGELMADPAETVLAYRDGERWAQVFEPRRLEPAQEPSTILREGGVYLFTGGLGNVCLALAEELARTVRAKLVLIGRTAFPVRKEWPSHLRVHGENDPVSRRIRRIQALEILGSEVMVLRADVTSERQMAEAMKLAGTRFGQLNGIVHGAGTIARESFFGIDQATAEASELHLGSKARGLLVLDRIVAKKELDFVLLVSSLSSILAGIGFVAYASANAYLDAFAELRNRRGRVPWFSVDWDNWAFGGSPENEGPDRMAMSPAEGVETFRRLLRPSAPRRVAVSATELQTRIDQWIHLKSGTSDAGAPPAVLHGRPELATEHVAPRTDVERSLAEIWQGLLGIQEIGIHDNFFELGGQSLLATQLVARVRQAFKTDLPLRRFFEGPTVAELAVAIGLDAQQNGSQAAASLKTTSEVVHP